MSSVRTTSALLLPFALLLSACGGGGDDTNDRLCTYINGGGTTLSTQTACASCAYTQVPAAADGTAATSAQMSSLASGGGNIAIRVNAQNGIVFPGNSQVGVVMAYHFDNSTSPRVLLTTYQDGTLKEQFNIYNGISGFGGNSEPRTLFKFQANMPFDAVEVGFIRGSSTSRADFDIYEFCSDR